MPGKPHGYPGATGGLAAQIGAESLFKSMFISRSIFPELLGLAEGNPSPRSYRVDVESGLR